VCAEQSHFSPGGKIYSADTLMERETEMMCVNGY